MEYITEHETDTGWTDWIAPIHGSGKTNYKFKCCDCGLVHDIQFRIKGRDVILRLRRNNRATAAGRRKK